MPRPHRRRRWPGQRLHEHRPRRRAWPSGRCRRGLGQGQHSRRSTAARRADLAEGSLLCQGPTGQLLVKNPRRVPLAVRRHGRAQTARCRRGAVWPVEHGRVCNGELDREFGVRAQQQPVGLGARAGWIEWRLRGSGRGAGMFCQHRHRHRRLNPPTGGTVRLRRPQADLRARVALRRGGVRLVA